MNWANVMTAAFSVILMRYTGSNDVVLTVASQSGVGVVPALKVLNSPQQHQLFHETAMRIAATPRIESPPTHLVRALPLLVLHTAPDGAGDEALWDSAVASSGVLELHLLPSIDGSSFRSRIAFNPARFTRGTMDSLLQVGGGFGGTWV